MKETKFFVKKNTTVENSLTLGRFKSMVKVKSKIESLIVHSLEISNVIQVFSLPVHLMINTASRTNGLSINCVPTGASSSAYFLVIYRNLLIFTIRRYVHTQ